MKLSIVVAPLTLKFLALLWSLFLALPLIGCAPFASDFIPVSIPELARFPSALLPMDCVVACPALDAPFSVSPIGTPLLSIYKFAVAGYKITPSQAFTLLASTLTFASTLFAQPRVLVSLGAVGLVQIPSDGTGTVEHVVFPDRDRVKVPRIAAPTIPALMVKERPGGANWTTKQKERKAMCQVRQWSGQPRAAVALPRNHAEPQPALAKLWPVDRNRTIGVDPTQEANELSYCRLDCDVEFESRNPNAVGLEVSYTFFGHKRPPR